jgi:hypothetical protein
MKGIELRVFFRIASARLKFIESDFWFVGHNNQVGVNELVGFSINQRPSWGNGGPNSPTRDVIDESFRRYWCR